MFGFSLDATMEVTHPAKLALRATFDILELAGGMIKLKSPDPKSAGGPNLNVVVASNGVRNGRVI